MITLCSVFWIFSRNLWQNFFFNPLRTITIWWFLISDFWWKYPSSIGKNVVCIFPGKPARRSSRTCLEVSSIVNIRSKLSSIPICQRGCIVIASVTMIPVGMWGCPLRKWSPRNIDQYGKVMNIWSGPERSIACANFFCRAVLESCWRSASTWVFPRNLSVYFHAVLWDPQKSS